MPIENVKIGDVVLAWNEETRKNEYKPVVETFVNKTTELTHVFVNGQEIISTPQHPFYSPIKGWVPAYQLGVGDVLQMSDGRCSAIEKVECEKLNGTVLVYNFHVEADHTYYVADGILVHNTCSADYRQI